MAALSAIAGSVELLVWPRGNAYLSLELLQHTPFATFVVPGVLLMFAVGGSALWSAVAAWRRWPAAGELGVFAGGTLSVWIGAEIALFRRFDWLHAVYGSLGLAMLGLGIRTAWRAGGARARWVLAVTGAEAVGYLAPATAGVLTEAAGVAGVGQLLWLSAAGLVEGAALGAGQAAALPFRVRRIRYALLTAVAAGAVWGAVMGIRLLALDQAVPSGVRAGGMALAALVCLTAIGGAQWWELRRFGITARRWVGATALAWVAALPLSFAPGLLVDERTPLGSNLALWACGGLAMAYVMAQLTWLGVLPGRGTALVSSAQAGESETPAGGGSSH